MSQSEERSLHEMRRQTEQTRAALTTSVAELRGTVSDTATDIKNRLRPEAVKAEVSGYIRSRGEQLLDDLTVMAQRNPMQAVAIGASVAYPAWRLARAIPLPVLMIGAGLLLTSSKTGRDLTRKASEFAEDVSDEAWRRAHDLGDQVSQTASDAKSAAAAPLNRTSETLTAFADQYKRKGSEAADALRSRVEAGSKAAEDGAGRAAAAMAFHAEATRDKMSQAAGSSARAAQEAVSEASEFVRNAGTRAVDSGREFLASTRSQATRLGDQVAGTFRETAQQNPLLVAGMGVLIGGLIASALPKFNLEESVAGSASARVKRKASQAAVAGFEAAKDATGEILAKAAQQASAEGLTPEGLAEGAQDVRERLQRVAERAVTTAFDPDHQHDNQQSENTGGGKQHG
jgi:hypothetical protein